MSEFAPYFEQAGLGQFDVCNPIHHELAYAAYLADKDREMQATEQRRYKARHRRYGAALHLVTAIPARSGRRA